MEADRLRGLKGEAGQMKQTIDRTDKEMEGVDPKKRDLFRRNGGRSATFCEGSLPGLHPSYGFTAIPLRFYPHAFHSISFL